MEVKASHIFYNINVVKDCNWKGKTMVNKEQAGILTLYSDVQATSVRWLWYPFIAVGKITLLQGDPGDGKSTMMMNLIASLSNGECLPDGKPVGMP